MIRHDMNLFILALIAVAPPTYQDNGEWTQFEKDLQRTWEAREDQLKRCIGTAAYSMRVYRPLEGELRETLSERSRVTFRHSHPNLWKGVKGSRMSAGVAAPVDVEEYILGDACRIVDHSDESTITRRVSSRGAYGTNDPTLPFCSSTRIIGTPLPYFASDEVDAVQWSRRGDTVVLSCESPRTPRRYEITLLPGAAYHPSSFRTFLRGRGNQWFLWQESEMTVREWQKGVWLPEQVTRTWWAWQDGTKSATFVEKIATTTFENIAFPADPELPAWEGGRGDVDREVDKRTRVPNSIAISDREEVLRGYLAKARAVLREADSDPTREPAIAQIDSGSSTRILAGRLLWALSMTSLAIYVLTRRRGWHLLIGLVLGLLAAGVDATNTELKKAQWDEILPQTSDQTVAPFCGPECLFLTATANGGDVSLSEVLETVRWDRRAGTTVLALGAAAAQLGVTGTIIGPADPEAGSVAILHLTSGHYIARLGTIGDCSLVVDPSFGPFMVENETLAAFASGWAYTLRPDSEAEP